MALIRNPQYDPSDPTSQKFIFSEGTTEGERIEASQITGQELKDLSAPDITETSPFNIAGRNIAIDSSNRIVDTTGALGNFPERQEADRVQRENRLTTIEKELGVERTERSSDLDRFEELLKKAPSREREVRRLQAQFKVDQNLDEINLLTPEIASLREQIGKITGQRDLAIESLTGQGRGIPASILNKQAAKLERQFNIRIAATSATLGAKAALVSALQGNVSQARTLISDAVEAKLYDFEQKRQDFQDLFEFNSDTIDALSLEQKTLLTQRRDELEDEAKLARDDAEEVARLMIKFPKSGISLDDSRDEATNKAAGFKSTEPDSSSDRFTTTQENKGASKAGVEIPEFLSYPNDVKNFYLNTPQTALDAFSETLAEVSAGDTSVDEMLQFIDDEDIPEQVKEHLRGRVEDVADTSPTGGAKKRNPILRTWDAVKSFFARNASAQSFAEPQNFNQ